MRSSKSRSRSKSNRNRSVGNIINRVFDSSGPEGKVRGTPQQIIDKYNQLARDAQLSGDRVATENFQQHSEHYTRMLGEALREQEAKREQQEQQQRDRQRDQPSERGQSDDQPSERGQRDTRSSDRGQGGGDSGRDETPAPVFEVGESGESGLVETPESTVPRGQKRSSSSSGRGRGSAKKDAAGEGEAKSDAATPDGEPRAAE